VKIHASLTKRFAANLSRVLEERKLSHEQAAEIFGCSRVYVGYLARGDRTPSIAVVELVARKLGMSDPIDMLR
jgi:transcriptional regulator with XRE-family HTH domain